MVPFFCSPRCYRVSPFVYCAGIPCSPTFSFCGGANHNDGYLMNTPGDLFLFAGDAQEFPLVTQTEETTIDDTDEMEEESLDELDFSMF